MTERFTGDSENPIISFDGSDRIDAKDSKIRITEGETVILDFVHVGGGEHRVALEKSEAIVVSQFILEAFGESSEGGDST